MRHGHGRSGWVAGLGTVPLVWLALAASGPLAGCSREPSGHGDVEPAGSIGLELTAAPGVTLSSVTYTITGNGFSKAGAIDTSGSPTISGTIGGIPAGKGYTITLTAKSAEGDTTFTGSATFDVMAGATTAVTLHLNGVGKTANGSVAVNGTVNVNPRIDELTVTPQTVFVGGSIKLLAVGTDPDAGPSPLSYYWSTTGGVIDNPISPSATLTSTTAGTFTITLTLSDGDGTDTAATTVTFVRPSVGGGGVDGGAAGAGGGGGAVAGGASKPNILLIIADDLGAEATSLYPDLAGTKGQVAIPNIETLARNGVVFDNAWASPVCSPTRGTIVSGQYGFRTGVTTVGNVLPTSTVTLFDRLTAESPTYTHAFFGKYHLGGGSPGIDPRAGTPLTDAARVLQHVRDLGITTYRGILTGGLTDYFSWTSYDINGPEVASTTYTTTVLTNYAIDFIHQQQTVRPDQPWFLYQAFNAPHAANGGNNPFQVPPPELHHVDLSSVGNPAPGVYQTNIPVYQSDIQALDTEIGRLLAEVDFSKTVVIFVGDNGVPPPVKDAATGLRDAKGSAYEGGVRVPLIVAGAGVTRRGREDNLFVTSDLYATILDVAGVPVSHVNDSYSLKPLFTDEATSSGRTFSFSEISNGTNQRQYGLRDTRFKLVNNLGKWELYDLVADSHETTNLYGNAQYAAARAALQAHIAGLKATAPAGYFQ
jgi:arylsulfatase A-like enzyme